MFIEKALQQIQDRYRRLESLSQQSLDAATCDEAVRACDELNDFYLSLPAASLEASKAIGLLRQVLTTRVGEISRATTSREPAPDATSEPPSPDIPGCQQDIVTPSDAQTALGHAVTRSEYRAWLAKQLGEGSASRFCLWYPFVYRTWDFVHDVAGKLCNESGRPIRYGDLPLRAEGAQVDKSKAQAQPLRRGGLSIRKKDVVRLQEFVLSRLQDVERAPTKSISSYEIGPVSLDTFCAWLRSQGEKEPRRFVEWMGAVYRRTPFEAGVFDSILAGMDMRYEDLADE